MIPTEAGRYRKTFIEIGSNLIFDSLKNLRSSFKCLRVCTEFIEVTNGCPLEIIGNFPFMLSLVEAFLAVFSRIISI